MLSLRPWRLSDAKFIISIRNKSELKKWFRQDHNLTLKEQINFMVTNYGVYRGYIILADTKSVGVIANHKNELCIAAPFKYHAEAIRLLEYIEKPQRLFGDVLFGNPMLNTYLKAGFKIKSVRIEKCLQ